LNFSRLIEELRKRHALPESKSKTREELELLLHDIVAQEPCCGDDDNNRPCTGMESIVNRMLVSVGMGCWWHQQPRSYHNKHNGNNNNNLTTTEITPKIIQSRCGNPNGMYTVDLQHIDNHRIPFLKGQQHDAADAAIMTMMMCHPINQQQK
jgi:hypothetical protein